jgi:hypothetical protein
LLFLHSSHLVQAQSNPYLCKNSSNYVPSPTTKGPIGQNPARTCNEWVSEYNNNVLSGEDFSAEYNCTGQSNDVVDAIEAIVGIGCCGGNSGEAKSTCWTEKKFICYDQANYEPFKQVTVGGHSQTCDNAVNNLYGGILATQDFSAAYDCAGKSNDVVREINDVAEAGCCGGNSGQPKSACYVDNSNICLVPLNYEPFKQVTVGGHSQTCDNAVNNLNGGVLAAQNFSAAYDCAGKSNDVVSLINHVVEAGCCGGNSGAAKSACWLDRSHICETPANYVASPTTKSANWGQNTGECG